MPISQHNWACRTQSNITSLANQTSTRKINWNIARTKWTCPPSLNTWIYISENRQVFSKPVLTNNLTIRNNNNQLFHLSNKGLKNLIMQYTHTKNIMSRIVSHDLHKLEEHKALFQWDVKYSFLHINTLSCILKLPLHQPSRNTSYSTLAPYHTTTSEHSLLEHLKHSDINDNTK